MRLEGSPSLVIPHVQVVQALRDHARHMRGVAPLQETMLCLRCHQTHVELHRRTQSLQTRESCHQEQDRHRVNLREFDPNSDNNTDVLLEEQPVHLSNPCADINAKANVQEPPLQSELHEPVVDNVFLASCGCGVIPLNGSCCSPVPECHAVARLITESVIRHSTFEARCVQGQRCPKGETRRGTWKKLPNPNLRLVYDIVCQWKKKTWR